MFFSFHKRSKKVFVKIGLCFQLENPWNNERILKNAYYGYFVFNVQERLINLHSIPTLHLELTDALRDNVLSCRKEEQSTNNV